VSLSPGGLSKMVMSTDVDRKKAKSPSMTARCCLDILGMK
jgi:hypothetical protein